MDRFQLFSNGTEFMWWQSRNCEQCVKAVWYNEKRDFYPKYRCMVQKHIEEAADIDRINEIGKVAISYNEDVLENIYDNPLNKKDGFEKSYKEIVK